VWLLGHGETQTIWSTCFTILASNFQITLRRETHRNSYAVLGVRLVAYLFRDAESRAPVGSIPDSCLGDNRAHVLAWILDVVNEEFMFLLVPPEQMLGYYLKLGLCICYSPTIYATGSEILTFLPDKPQ
jgi:hypothetical protein